MFGSQILDVAIGVIFVFILVSIICTAVREGLEAWLKTRSAYLEQGLRELLRDSDATGLVQQLYSHPQVSGLFSGDYAAARRTGGRGVLARGGDLPSYIPSKNFALALLDITARGPGGDADAATHVPLSLESIRANVSSIPSPAIQRVLLMAIDSAQGDLSRAQANLEAWYDSAMDRVSGWYKRSTHFILLCIAIFLAVAMNIDAMRVARYLYQNEAARASIVAAAGAANTEAGRAVLDSAGYTEATRALGGLGLPIGWKNFDLRPGNALRPAEGKPGYKFYRLNYAGNIAMCVLGWLITALAATLGAPFWFDVLNKVMVIRSTVKPHEKSREEASEDRQTKPVPTGGDGRKAA